MDEKADRIRSWMKGEEKNPYTLELNPTNRCNLNCKFCWQRSTVPNYHEEMNEEKILSIVEEAAEIGVKEFRIPGSGEPLVRKDLISKMIKKIKDHRMQGLLISNGTLIDNTILEKMVEKEWDILTISIDGPDARTHDFLRDKDGTFQKAKDTMEKLNQLKEKHGKQKPMLRFNTVLSNRNYDKMSEIVELANQYECEDIQVQPMTVFSEKGEDCKLKGHKKDLNDSIKAAKRLAEKYDIYTNMDTFIDNDIVDKTEEMDKVVEEDTEGEKNDFISAACFEPWYNMVILPNGKTAQCSMFGGKKGDNIKNKTLKEVWFGDYFEKARDRVLNHDLFSYCKNCCVPVNLESKRIREKLKEGL